MNRKDIQALLNNPYLRYNQEELALELDFLFNKETHPNATAQIRREAAEKRALVYDMVEVFNMVSNLKDSKGNPFDLSGETSATILQAMTGRKIGELKTSMGSVAANSLDSAVTTSMKWLRKGAAATGVALVKFGKK